MGIAAATLPNAIVDNVIQAIFYNLDEKAYVNGRDDGLYADYAGINMAMACHMR